MLKTNLRSALLHAAVAALSLSAMPAIAGSSLFPGLPPACPPNTSCVPGTQPPGFPPIIPPVTPPGTCGPGHGGATCPAAGAGPATNNSGPGLNLGAGNPINIITGNKYQREVDMAPLPGVLGLEIVRHYNSAFSGENQSTNLVGRGWKLSYETDLFVAGKTVQIIQADGTRLIFNRDPANPSLCSGANPADGSVTVRKGAGGEQYVWRWANGRELSFDQRGKLVQILAPNGQFVSLQHDARGLLVRVTDPQGRSLQLSYLDKNTAAAGGAYRGVQRIDSPVGAFRYSYGSPMPKGAAVAPAQLLASLVKVEMPSGARYYHYENAQFPTYLTGISEHALDAAGHTVWQRVATYGYDENGKGNLSVKGAPARLARGADGKLLQPARLAAGTGVEQVTLEHGGGETILTNSLGQKTRFRHTLIGGEYRLLEVRGAGCSTCGDTNMRYGYDAAGHLTASMKLDAAGTVLSADATEYDAQGRPRLVTHYPYAAGKPLAGQWKLRYEYPGSSMLPARIVRPSVVPGREYVTALSYVASGAAAGMPSAVTETGFLPTFEGKGVAGTIARTVAYRYDGYGQRTETDGPLPNAPGQADPSNSDITRTEYDARTKMPVRTIAPGNVVTEIVARDAALRLHVLRTSDAAGSQTVTTRNNWRGQPEEVRIDSVAADGAAISRTIRYAYGPNGPLLSLTQPGGLTSRFVYDAAGRMTHKILPDGSKVATTLDTEGQRQALSLYSADAQLVAHTAFRFDPRNRLAGTSDALGSLGEAGYTDAGQVAQLTNALGTSTRFEYDANGQLISRTSAAGSADAATVGMRYDINGKQIGVTDANGVVTSVRYDDFGRKMLEVNADRGVTLYYYDAASRLLVRSDGRGNTVRFAYDVQGHMLSAGSDKVAGLTQYRYLGRRLVEVLSTPDGKAEHATERTSYRHDALGQVREERRWLARTGGPAGAGGLLFVTRTEYDDAGRVASQILPDGHRLRYRYAAAGGVDAILFDGQPVVDAIKQSTAGGLRAYTHANGVQQRIVLDARGRVVELTAQAGSGRHWWSGLGAWFGKRDAAGGQVLYSQANRYDVLDRLTAVGRKRGASASGAGESVAETYEYDRLDRLTSIAGTDGTALRYTYDKGGNRSAEQESARLLATGSDGQAPRARNYLYAEGSNRLIGITGEAGPGGERQFAAAFMYHPGGVPMGQIGFSPAATTLGAAGTAGASRRIVYNASQRPTAVLGARGEPIATYRYNTDGERVSKTVYAPAIAAPGMVRTASVGQPQGETTYSLYRDRQLAAEADRDGRITAHYLYLHGKPVAKIEMAAKTGVLQRLKTALGLAPEGETLAQVYAIHTDHLGTPQAVSDAAGQIVWQARVSAFGQARIVHAALSPARARPFEMNLRLPGQVYDAETGLSQNYFRDYDPALGRYTTPDPMGLAGGLNPYLYADANPLTKIDPLGLYQSDIHYYMNMFLAIAAGMSPEEARLLALAAQYVDDNDDTRPLNVSFPSGLTDAHRARLLSYHFTMVPSSVDPATGLVKGGVNDYGTPTDSTDYAHIAENPQLGRLYAAVGTSQNEGNLLCKRSTQLQFMGEYLHSFEDTFAHRDSNNHPFPLEIGLGHGLYGSNPDYTYNHWSMIPFPNAFHWDHNEDRTFAMESEVYTKLAGLGGTGTVHSFDSIKTVLQQFNAIDEHEGHGYEPGDEQDSEKIKLLQATLNSWGVTGVNWTDTTQQITGRYSKSDGAANRNKYLCDKDGNPLSQISYSGTILPACNSTPAPHSP